MQNLLDNDAAFTEYYNSEAGRQLRAMSDKTANFLVNMGLVERPAADDVEGDEALAGLAVRSVLELSKAHNGPEWQAFVEAVQNGRRADQKN